jgi:hypothetical protein
MASTAHNLRRQQLGGTATWERGTYLTDGLRLFCVVGADGDAVYLENVRSESLERWSAHQLRPMREVKPCPAPN